jgi:polyisoprenoid-binding protein YceI
MKRSTALISSVIVLSALGFARRAALQSFDFADPKGANGIAFEMIGGMEPLHGFGNGVSGNVMFDVQSPSKSTGKIEIDMDSLKLTSDVMGKNMKGGWCLDVEKFPKATFEVNGATVKSNKSGIITGTVMGKFTVKGITKQITVPVTAKYEKDGVKTRFGQADKAGDVLLISTEFSFMRSDYGIGDSLGDKLLSNKVDVKLHVAGMAFVAK